MTAMTLVTRLRGQGVGLSIAPDGGLEVTAPAGALTEADWDEIREAKEVILTSLDHAEEPPGEALTNLAILAEVTRRQAVEAEAALASLAVKRRALAVDVRLGHGVADDLAALDREIDGHRQTLAGVADLLPEIEGRLIAERADFRARALVALEELLAGMVNRRDALRDQILAEHQPSARLVDEYGRVAREVGGLGHDLAEVTGRREHRDLGYAWRPGAGLDDRTAALSPHTHRGPGPRPMIDRPWTELITIARGGDETPSTVESSRP